MSDCRVPSYHPPASSMQTLAPARVSTCAATPPPAPDPTTTTSYDFDFELVCTWAMGTFYACSPLLLHTHTCDATASLFKLRALAKLLFCSICELACCRVKLFPGNLRLRYSAEWKGKHS